MIQKEKQEELTRKMERLGIRDEDLEEKFILGSGAGGQKINKTSSCVSLRHLPSGISIKCQRTRSRELNRLYARRELCDRIEAKLYQVETERQRLAAKIRKQKQRRSRRTQAKVLEGKRARSTTKGLRGKPGMDT